jgi:hypothetical protein
MPSLDSPQPRRPIAKLRRAGNHGRHLFFIGLKGDTDDPQHLPPVPRAGHAARRSLQSSRTLADDVEDHAGRVRHRQERDGAVHPHHGVSGATSTPNFSTQAGGDEWFPNVTGETLRRHEFQSPARSTRRTAASARAHCPTLHGVMVSLLAKARDSDPTTSGPAAHGYKLMDSTATAVTRATTAPRPDAEDQPPQLRVQN